MRSCGLAFLLGLPFFAVLAASWAGVRLAIADIVVLAASLTLQLLLCHECSNAHEDFRSRGSLLREPFAAAVPASAIAFVIYPHVLHAQVIDRPGRSPE